MNILFLGGSGIISTACVELAVARGMKVSMLTRSRRGAPPPGVQAITADLGRPDEVAGALNGRCWDAVLDFLSYTPADIEQRLALFRGRAGHYIFISSASAYQKPLRGHHLITESTPLSNPLWEYSRNKIACEERLLRALREENFPGTIVRPSLTYGNLVIPLAVNSWPKSWTAIDRMRRGQPLIVPGDGLTLWTMTHNTDFAKAFVGLIGNAGTIGHAFHITSDEALTWNDYYTLTAEAAGIASPRFIHIASDFITRCSPDSLGTLTGDKSNCALFDNTKIKRFVPDYVATVRYREGIARTIAAFEADPARQQIDAEANARWDALIAAYERGLEAAVKALAPHKAG